MSVSLEENPRFLSSFFKVPYIMGITATEALPGPTLIELMVAIGGSESANKSVLHRMSAGEALELERHGRVGQYRLIGQIAEEFRNLVLAKPLRPGWDGRFHAIVYNIPETDRANRIRLRTDAFAHGYAALRSGLLIGPTDQSHYFIDRFVGLDILRGWLDLSSENERRLVRESWDLDALYPRYAKLTQRFDDMLASDLTAVPGPAAFRQLHDVVGAALELHMLSGSLPHELLPEDWPGEQLESRLHTLIRSLGPQAQAFGNDIIEATAYPQYVERFVGADPFSFSLR